MTTRKKRPTRAQRVEAATEEQEDEFAIIFPFDTVEMTTGEKIDVKQWDIDTGASLTARVVSMFTKIKEAGVTGDVEPEELLAIAKEECVDIVCGTIGWTRKELNARVPFEDFLKLLDVVANQNLVREDGGGVLPKIVGLAGIIAPLGALSERGSASVPPSTSSSEPDTPSPISDA